MLRLTSRRSSAPLDARVAQLRVQPGRSWGAGQAVLAVLAVPAVLLLLRGLHLLLPELSAVALSVLGTAALAGVVVLLARPAAQESGRWSDAFGLDLPQWADSGRVLGWAVLLTLGPLAVLAGLRWAVPGLAGAVPDNASFLRYQPPMALLGYVLLAVTVAPVLEELLFRGLVLRGLMLRLGFWPAALVSSAGFGLFHAQDAGPGSTLLIVALAVLGLGLCVLTRRTGRLGPAIGVHAVRNAVAVYLAVRL